MVIAVTEILDIAHWLRWTR